MKRNKSGVSLIVLVITIIVMIILAGTIILSLSNNGIIGKANEAVEKNNLQEVKNLAALVWTEAYLDETITTDEQYDTFVKTKLSEQGINIDNYAIEVTKSGVNVSEITLGYLIQSAEDYGKTVDYVSDNGVTDWKVFYATEEHVYLIASDVLAYDKIPEAFKSATGVTITEQGGIVNTGSGTIQRPTLWMANWNDGNYNNAFLDETLWAPLKNTKASYASYVKGSIGTPTVEMFAASWNAKKEAINDTNIYNTTILLEPFETIGYYVTNGDPDIVCLQINAKDGLYVTSSNIWLASPHGAGYPVSVWLTSGYAFVGDMVQHPDGMSYTYIRPVVCLEADVPAKMVTETHISLGK